ncbi:unnamed protein product, partial [Closterium sp. Naga37s-1]
LLALKASLGVTFTTWAATVPCEVAGKQAATQTTWSGVLCGDTGDVLSISVARQSLQGSIHADISKLTALTYLGLFSNYLTGTMPIPSTSLVALDVGFNFLSGSFPQLSLAVCAADQNCFLNSSYCHSYGVQQRPTSACAICGTTNGQGTLCGGATCYANSYVPAGSAVLWCTFLRQQLSGARPLGVLGLPGTNFLTGSIPAMSTALKQLFISNNYITSIPTHSLTNCAGSMNCLSNPSKCASDETTQRPAAECAICGTTNAVAPFCWGAGGECVVAAAANIAAGKLAYLKPAPPMVCSALLALKTSLGVTFTTWAASVPCQMVGKQAATQTTWSGVLCGDSGDVIYMDLSSNLFRQNLASFTSGFSKLQALKQLYLNNNWFAGSIPTALVSLPTLTYLKSIDLPEPPEPKPPTCRDLHTNALTGTVPALPTSLLSLDIQDNFLAGSFPAASLTSCDASSNCLASAMACSEASAVGQRDGDTCSFCESQDGQGVLCFGGSCLPDVDNSTVHDDGMDPPDMYCIVTHPSSLSHLCRPSLPQSPLLSLHAPHTNSHSASAAGSEGRAGGDLHNVGGWQVVHHGFCRAGHCRHPHCRVLASSPVLPLVCIGAASVPMDATQAAALMNVKVTLGVSFPDWRVDALCTLVGSPSPAPGTWNGVACDDSGKVLRVDLQSNRLEGKMDAFTANIKTPLVLKELYLQYNYLYGAFPSALLALTTLSTLSVAFNYLIGSLPTTLPTTLASLDVQRNFLAGSVAANSIAYCASTGNCLVDASKCASLGLPQRSAAECAVCGSTNGQGALCAAATTCRVAAAGAGVTTPPTALSASLPLFCEAIPMDLATSDAQTMLAIKAALGVTLTDWTATLPLLKPSSPTSPKSLPRSSSVPLAATQGTCTLEGQIPGPGAWTGVYCRSKGVAVGIDLSSNLFQRRLDVFLSLVSALKALQNLKRSRNYLTGTVPAFKTTLKALNVASNLLSGAFPAISLTACDARSNCLSSATNCANAAGTAQRLSSECSVCGSTDASGVLCGGGLCAPDASAPAASSTPNTDGQPLLPLSCLGVPMDAAMGLALLSVKASLGVTFTDWNVDAPYALAGQGVVPGSWSSVVCDATGKASLGVSFTDWAVSSPCAMEGVAAPPGAWSNVLCDSTFKPVSLHGCVGGMGSWEAWVRGRHGCVGGTGAWEAWVRGRHGCVGGMGAWEAWVRGRHGCVGGMGAWEAWVRGRHGLHAWGCLGHKLEAGTIHSSPVCMIISLLPFVRKLELQQFLPSFSSLFFSHHVNPPQIDLPIIPFCLHVLPSCTYCPSALALLHVLTSSTYRPPPPSQPHHLTHGSNFNFNWFSASIPSALVGIASLTSFGASYNYLYGPVPKLGTALKTIDVQKNWLSGTFPGTGFLSCSASSNCFANIGACNTTGTTQRPLASCSVCDSLKGTDPICAGGTCAPNTAGPLATFTTPTTSSPILLRFCVGVPLNAAQAAILLSVKTALGVTFTEWSASTISAKARTLTSEISNGPKALKRRHLAESEAGRERVLLVAPPSVQAGLCTIQGQTPVPGSWPGVFCSSAGIVVGLDLRNFLLRGTVHADISKLTTLTALYLSSNLFFQRLDSFVAPILPTASLKDMAVSFNWLYGSVPSKLVTMAALSNLSFLFRHIPLPNLFRIDINHLPSILPPLILVFLLFTTTSHLSYNYLTGSMPKPGATLKVIDMQANFLSGTFPTATLACNTRLNCFSNATGCFNLDGTEQRGAAECSMCGSTQKKLGLCGGGTCLPVLSPSLAKVPNSAAAATLTLTCAAVPLDATSAFPPPLSSRALPPAVAALLKVGAALGVRDTDWRNGSKCNIEGQSANPKSFPGVWCSANGTVLNITLPNKALRGIIHADISKLTALSYLRLGANYLTGTLPAMATQLQVLAIASNLLAGAFPTQPFQLCDIRSNCLSSPGSCTNDAGVAQRTSGCAFCGSATGAPPFCAGTTCTPDVAARLAAGTVNNLTSTLPAMFCEAVAVDENSTLALLALRAGLGVSALSWAVDSPCTLAGNAPAVDSWTGVVCDLSGQVLSLNVASNLLDARMSEWALPLTGLKALKQLSLNYNWFSGPLPSFLLTMSSLSALNVQFNYLAGPITGTPSASLKSLNVASNHLTGTFPASSTTACDARSNCLADSSKCLASGFSSQRLASDCDLCGAGSSSAVICNGGVCMPDTTEPMAALTPNDASATLLPMQCSGARIDATAVSVLGSLKAALGVPYPDWGGNSLCTVVIIVSGVSSSSPGPRDLGDVLCSPAGAVVSIDLNSRQLAGSMHADISKLTALTALQLHYNYLFGSIPSSLIGLKSLSKLSVGSNYLTGSVPVPGTAMKHLDLENNYLVGTFPAGSLLSCSARTNCFSSAAACTADGGKGTVQRATCSICGSADGTGVLCGGGGASTCQPTAESLASLSLINSPNTPALPLECSLLPAVPVNSTAMAALLSIKTALGVTHTGWAANAVCTLAGTAGTVASGSLTGVECDSAGNPVKITLNNQQLFGMLPADVTKLTALTHLLLDFNWFKGSLPPPLLAMTKLTQLSMAYNYLTYRVPPVSASLKAIVLSNNFLSGTFPANSATSCVSAANCFTSATSCNTPTEGGVTEQRASGCDICGSASGQGMLCGGTGVCTPNAAALFTAKTVNTAAAAVLPMSCVDLVCAAAAPIACPTDWRCQGLKCAAPAVSNCNGYLCTP